MYRKRIVRSISNHIGTRVRPEKPGRSGHVRIVEGIDLARAEEWLKLRDRLLANLPAEAFDGLEDLRERRPAPERDWP